MKKLIIVAAAMLTGLAVNAAAVTWSSGTVTGAGLPGSDGSITKMSGVTFTLYSITEAQYNGYADSKAVYDGFKASEFSTSVASATSKSTGKANISGQEMASWSAGNSYYQAVIAEYTGSDNKVYYIANTVKATVGDDNTASVLNYATNWHGNEGAAIGWTAAAAAPEPTSGLLLLLGVAGLALKRKRA